MEIDIITILILCVIFLIAGFVDSIAGGGGLITLPSLLMFGLPPLVALGTNKFASTCGTATAVVNFQINKKINWKQIVIGIPFSLLAAFIGTKFINAINQEIVAKIIVILLPIAVIAVLVPKKKKINSTKEYKYIPLKIIAICSVIGMYDGFFGPGTGTFLTIFLYYFTNNELINSSANAKVFNLCSNIASLLVFIFANKVILILAIPLAIANIIGNYLGSFLAIRKGDKIIKVFLIIMLFIIMINLIYKFYL